MFYICDEKNGKYGVKDTKDGVVEYYTADELHEIKQSLKCSILGSLKNNKYYVIDMIEYQTLDSGDYEVFSFVNKIGGTIHIGVLNKTTLRVHYKTSVYSQMDTDEDFVSMSENRNGDLIWIFDEGKVNKCLGFALWLDYNDCGDNCTLYCDFYMVIKPDGTGSLIDSNAWTWDETGHEYKYNPDTDWIE